MVSSALKIVLKGDQGVGKTTIAAQFAEKVFDLNDFNSQPDYRKNVTVEDVSQKVELLDIPDDYHMGDYFTEYGQGFLLVYSVADYQTFESVKSMRKEILRIKKSKNVPIILVGNKRDVSDADRAVDHEEAALVAESWHCRFSEISARSYDEVERVFELLVKDMLTFEQRRINKKKEKDGCHCSLL